MRQRTLASRAAQEHARELLTLERHELAKLAAVYEEARVGLLGRLMNLATHQRADTFTAQHLRAALAQVQAGIAAMTARLADQHRPVIERSVRRAIRQTLDEIAEHEGARFFGDGPVGRIETAALRAIEESGKLLLERFEGSLDVFGRGLVEDLRRTLGVHVAMRSTWTEMARDVAGLLTATGVRGSQWRAERIIRTELVNALNTGHQAALESAAERIPDLKRQWDAHLDKRTSDVCRGLDGVVVGVTEPFEIEGRRIMHPPAHPNCRSRVVPWRAEWLDRKPA